VGSADRAVEEDRPDISVLELERFEPESLDGDETARGGMRGPGPTYQ